MPQETAGPPIETEPRPVVPLPNISSVWPLGSSSGSDKAPITVIIFSDFESFLCARSSSVLVGLLGENKDVHAIFKHSPASTNPNSLVAHEAALAARAQGPLSPACCASNHSRMASKSSLALMLYSTRKAMLHAALDWAPAHPNDDRNIRGFPMMRATATASQFAGMLARAVNRPVINRTGLTDIYSIFLSYAPMSPQASDKVQDFGPPDIFIALQEQLGLKLESGKGKLDVAVIDHIEPVPTEN
jgi:hypothetical protein